MSKREDLRVKAYNSHEYMHGLKEEIYSWGYRDAWRDLTQEIITTYPDLKEKIEKLVRDEQ